VSRTGSRRTVRRDTEQFEAMLLVTERRVLEVLDRLGPIQSLSRRAIQGGVFGDAFGASHTASALRRLRTKGQVVEIRMDAFRITPAGRAVVHDNDGAPAA
jgi:hypothetical protein